MPAPRVHLERSPERAQQVDAVTGPEASPRDSKWWTGMSVISWTRSISPSSSHFELWPAKVETRTSSTR